METLRILMIAPTPFFADRGCHVHIAEQAIALQRLGHTVHVVTYGIGRDLPGIQTTRTWKFPWYSKESMGPSWHKFYVDICLFFTTLRVAWKLKPDVIHAHLHEGCFIGASIRVLLGIPFVFDCQGSLTGELLAHNFSLAKPNILRRAWLGFERWIDSLPDAVLAQSTEMRQELTELFAVPAEKVTMAYDGVNTHAFRPGRRSEALARKLNIPRNRKIIVYLGGLAPHKGVDTLLQAYAHVRTAVPDSFLLLMGYPNVEKYRTQARQLGLLDHMRITGKVPYEQAPDYLALGDIAIAPKRTQTEANGKIYSYMACGLPTVAFDTIVNRDILGKLGVYVQSRAASDQLAETITQLLQDDKKREALAVGVRQKAEADYSWDNVAQRIEAAYRRIIPPWQLVVFSVSIRKKEKWQWIAAQLKRHLSKTARCLDIGSGVGTLSVQQEQMGGHWEFTELDADAAQETAAVVDGPVYQYEIDDARLAPASYDIVTAFDVIEHVRDPQQFLRRISNLLVPGGYALLTTPAKEKPKYFWRRAANVLFGIDDAAHGHEVEGFSRQQLKIMAATAQLNTTHVDSFSFFFTEFIELLYNGAYIHKNRTRQQGGGYNLALSPGSGKDVRQNQAQLMILRIVYPLLRAISLLDHIIPQQHGYELGIVVRKPE